MQAPALHFGRSDSSVKALALTIGRSAPPETKKGNQPVTSGSLSDYIQLIYRWIS